MMRYQSFSFHARGGGEDAGVAVVVGVVAHRSGRETIRAYWLGAQAR